MQVQRHFVFLVMPVIAQNEHARGFQEEAPHHAEGVRFAERIHVAPAGEDRGNLQYGDQVNDAVGSSEMRVRLAEPVQQNTVFGHAVHHSVGPDHGCVDCARQDKETHRDHKNMENQA